MDFKQLEIFQIINHLDDYLPIFDYTPLFRFT